MAQAVKKEKEFFHKHPVYSKMPAGYYGTDVLIQKLTKIYFRVIREHLPKIIKTINDNIKKFRKIKKRQDYYLAAFKHNLSQFAIIFYLIFGTRR